MADPRTLTQQEAQEFLQAVEAIGALRGYAGAHVLGPIRVVAASVEWDPDRQPATVNGADGNVQSVVYPAEAPGHVRLVLEAKLWSQDAADAASAGVGRTAAAEVFVLVARKVAK